MNKSVAFFDVDGTVINSSSGFRAAIHLYKHGYFKWHHLLSASYTTFLHYFNLVDHTEMYLSTIRALEGQRKRDNDRECHRIFHEDLKHKIFIGTWQIIEEHRRRGEPVVFISAGVPDLIQLMADFLHADDIIITPLDWGEDQILRINRNMNPRVCYGENKVTLALEYLSDKNVSLSQCYFYSDSSSDLPLLEKVGHPICINPDLELEIKARKKRWTVHKFKDTYKSITHPAKYPPFL